MTDKERAKTLLLPVMCDCASVYKELAMIVNKNQNGPPEGDADGSLSEYEWTTLRDAVSGLACIIRFIEST